MLFIHLETIYLIVCIISCKSIYRVFHQETTLFQGAILELKTRKKARNRDPQMRCF